MRARLFCVLFSVLTLAMATGWAFEGRSLEVTVEFEGGEVDSQHPIWVFVWDNSNFNGSIPIAMTTLNESGKTASFDWLTASPVFISVAYDEKGGYNPQMVGPPPSGTPISAHVAEGSPGPSPIELKEGEPTGVKIRFDGSFRMP